jgi:hypothetical protein
MLVKDLIARRSRYAKSVWIHLIERSNVEGAAALHLTSALEGAELERFGWRLPRLAVIPNAIDEPLSQNGEIASDVETIISEQPLVLFFGRLSYSIGCSAFACTPAGVLAIVGNDDEKFSPQRVKLAAELQIADRVRILPRTVIGVEKERLFAASTSLRATFVLGKLRQYRARGYATRPTDSGHAWSGSNRDRADIRGRPRCCRGPGAPQFSHPPIDGRPYPRAFDGRSRTTARCRTFYLGSRCCPDGRFVQERPFLNNS